MASVHHITPTELQELLDYDPETGVITWKWRARGWFCSLRAQAVWNAKWAGREAGCVSAWGYRVVKLSGKAKKAHCVIWAVVHGEWMPPGHFVDHINGDRADNRLANLRKATRAENGYNRAKGSNNTSGFKGVSFYAPYQMWCARIGHGGGKRQHLGYFLTAAEAATAYEQAARELHGKFAETSR